MTVPIFDDSQILESTHQVCRSRRTADGVELVFGELRPSASIAGASFSHATLRLHLSESAAIQLLQGLEKCSSQIVR
jgi:hypothetical protein